MGRNASGRKPSNPNQVVATLRKRRNREVNKQELALAAMALGITPDELVRRRYLKAEEIKRNPPPPPQRRDEYWERRRYW